MRPCLILTCLFILSSEEKRFFLPASRARARRFLDLQRNYSQIVREKHLPATSEQLIDLIFMRPVLNVRIAQEFLKVTFPAAQKAINALVEAGILTEITGGKRNKAYAAKEVLETLEAEISPQQV